MKSSKIEHNTNSVWIWTQIIPLWSIIAIPVTLIKLNNQFKTYIQENNIQNHSTLKVYNNIWGWVWFGGSVISIIFQPFALIAIIGLIVFWIHINSVRKSLIIINNEESK